MRRNRTPERKKVALLGIPDDALDVLNHYTQSTDWEAVLVVNETPGAYATRMAQVLGIPVQEAVGREELAECDLVIVGNDAGTDVDSIRSLLADTSVEITDLDAASQEMEFHPFAEGSAEAPHSGLGDEIDSVLRDFGAPESGEDSPPYVFREAAANEDPLPSAWTEEPAIERGAYAGPYTEPFAEPEVGPYSESDAGSYAESDAESDAEPGAGSYAEPYSEIEPETEPDAEYEDDGESAPYADIEEDEGEDEGASSYIESDSELELEMEPEPAPIPAPAPAPKARKVSSSDVEPWAPKKATPPPVPKAAPVPVSTSALGSAPVSASASVRDARPRTEGLHFDLSRGFGRESAEHFADVQIDDRSSDLRELFQRVLLDTGAKTASIMLPLTDGRHLAIAASVGLPAEIVSATRPSRDAGLVGRAFSEGTLAVHQAEVPEFAEAGGMTYRIAACLPLSRDGAVVGVLSVNLESTEPVSEETFCGALVALEGDALRAVLHSVDLRQLSPDARRDFLFRELDVIMSSDASFPDRLLRTAEKLQQGFHADYSHVYLVDPLSQRLEHISPDRNGVSAQGRYVPLDRGFFAWAVAQSRPLILTASDSADETTHAVAYLPVRVAQPYALLVLENFVADSAEIQGIQELLACVLEQLVELFEVERGMESQDILSGLRMRIADKKDELKVLPPSLRAQPALEFGLSILAAEAAIWIEQPDAKPVIAQPQTRQAVHIVADVWDSLDTLCAWIREHGSTAWGGEGHGWDPGAPAGPVPYVGVLDERQGGVLLAFFQSTDSGPSAQLPARILIDALAGISELISWGDDASDDSPESLDRAA